MSLIPKQKNTFEIEYTKEMAMTNALLIIREMMNGRRLEFYGYELGMSVDGFIGFVFQDGISMFSEITFSHLVAFCLKEKVIIIPK